MPKTPEPTTDDAFDISLGAARAHGCCSGWRPAGGRATAEIIELATARPPASTAEDAAHDDPER